MSDFPILFNKTMDDLRRIGALGGRAHARNFRARRQAAPQSPLPPAPLTPMETSAQAIGALDAHFPWLKGAERRGAAVGRS